METIHLLMAVLVHQAYLVIQVLTAIQLHLLGLLTNNYLIKSSLH